mmetsp:Transcript_19734/g.57254  ORF Transcript_19734/g.57254 Transcript_19734/m.57254 type:complete len:380 (+) Transcript_19734:1658-2797(+)
MHPPLWMSILMMSPCMRSNSGLRLDFALFDAWCRALFWVLSKAFTSTSSLLLIRYSTMFLLAKVAPYISAVIPRTSAQFRSGLLGSPLIRRDIMPAPPSAIFLMEDRSPATAASRRPLTFKYLGTNSTPAPRLAVSETLPMRSSPCLVARLIQPSTPRPLSARADTFARRLFMWPNSMMVTSVPGFSTALASLSSASETRTVISDFTSCWLPTSKSATMNAKSDPHFETRKSFALKLTQPWTLEARICILWPSITSITWNAVPTGSSATDSLCGSEPWRTVRGATVSPWSPAWNSTFVPPRASFPKGAERRLFIASLALETFEARLELETFEEVLPVLAVSQLSEPSSSPVPPPPEDFEKLNFFFRPEKLPFLTIAAGL